MLFVVDARAGLDRRGPRRHRQAAQAAASRSCGWPTRSTARSSRPRPASSTSSAPTRCFPVSAQHGRGVGELLDAVVARLPDAPRIDEQPETEDDATRPIKLALVGRPNAGKSSLVNRFVGDERVIVDAEAGTTRDPVDTPVELGGRRYVLIDTAGIRRRSKVHAPMEKIAVAMAEKAVGRCDVCVLVVDAAEGLAEQDAKVAGMCDEAGRALVILFNKLDLIDDKKQKKLHEDLKRQLQFVPWARVVFASARTGKGVQRILDAVQAAYAAYTRRVSTGALNRWFEGIVEKHPPSLYRGHPVKLYFIQQPQARPPTFLLSVNHPEGVHFSYRRYLANQLRDEFDLWGTPVRIVCKARGQKPRDKRKASESAVRSRISEPSVTKPGHLRASGRLQAAGDQHLAHLVPSGRCSRCGLGANRAAQAAPAVDADVQRIADHLVARLVGRARDHAGRPFGQLIERVELQADAVVGRRHRRDAEDRAASDR